MVNFPAKFICSIAIGFEYNPSTTFVFTNMIRILILYGNCFFPNFLNYFI